MDIQLFAEEVAADEKGENVEENKVDEVESKIEAALEKAQLKWKADWESEQKKREESERLSKLSEDERAKAELDNTRKELENQKVEFEKEKMKYEAAKVLAQRKLPVEFVDYLIGESNEKTLENIKAFESKFNKAVEEAVTLKLKGKAPSVSGKSTAQSSSSAFMKAIYDSQIKM